MLLIRLKQHPIIFAIYECIIIIALLRLRSMCEYYANPLYLFIIFNISNIILINLSPMIHRQVVNVYSPYRE
jgi:hypothetical protein